MDWHGRNREYWLLKVLNNGNILYFKEDHVFVFSRLFAMHKLNVRIGYTAFLQTSQKRWRLKCDKNSHLQLVLNIAHILNIVSVLTKDETAFVK